MEKKGGRRCTLVVDCSFDGSSVQGVICGCRKMECEAIPCAHIFAVLVHLDVETIPRCCVSKRWTMEAKAAFVSVRNANTHVWSAEMSRYRDLRNKANASLFKAAKSTECSQQVMDLLQNILDEPVENAANTEETSFGPIPAHYSASTRATGERVLDPKVIVPKGAPSKNRMKPVHEKIWESRKRKRRARKCSECGSLNHDIRKCPDLGRD